MHGSANVAGTDEASFDGAGEPDGDVVGTHIHGVCQNGWCSRAVFNELSNRKGVIV